MRRIALLALGLAAIAAPASAHVGGHAASGVAAGLTHPLTGLDHLMAMLAVGLWSGLAAPRSAWAWPAAFMAFMLAGFGAGLVGGDLAGVEALVAVSVIALGLAAATRLQLPALVGAAIVGVFASAHGYAHGREALGDAAGFAAGFSASTAALLLTGVGVAFAVRMARAPRLAQATGLGLAAAGAALAWAG